MPAIVPCLWYESEAEYAADTYRTLFPEGRIVAKTRYGAAGQEQHGQQPGTVMTVEFELAGAAMTAMNGGPLFRPTPAVSYFVTLPSHAQVQALWAGLLDGGEVLMPLRDYAWSPCYGWLDDRWGVSWQIMLQEATTPAIAPMLMFTGEQAGQAEAAMHHYVEVFPDSRIESVTRYDGNGEDPAGTVVHGSMALSGQRLLAMDSALPHDFGFSQANSQQILCDTQAEIDHYWQALSAEPEVEACGWLNDRFGVSWQVVPRRLSEMVASPDAAAVARVIEAMMPMKKLELATLERAFAG